LGFNVFARYDTVVPQSILNNAVIATSGRILNVALGLVVVALITRYLGPSSYGQYVLLLSFGTIVQLAADAGLYLTLSRQLARTPDLAKRLLSNTVGLRTVLLLVAFAAGAILAVTLPSFDGLLVPFVILSAGLGLQSISQLYMSVFQYHQTVWRATVGDLAGRAVQIVGIVALGLYMPTLTGVTAMFALGSFIAFVLHWFLSPIRTLALDLESPRSWSSILAVSWPLGVLLLLNAVYFRIDAVMLSLWRPAAEVAWYGLAYRIVESSLFFPAMLGGLLLPRLSETVLANPAQAGRYLLQGVRVVLVAGAAALVVLVSEGTRITVFIAGSSFSPSGPLLQLLAVALVIMFVGNMFGFALVALEKQRMLLGLYAVLAVGNLLANILFIPIWGASAAAVTTICTEAVAMGVAGSITWRALRLRVPWGLLARICVLAIGGIIFLQLLPTSWHLALRILVFGAFYIAAVGASGVVDKKYLSLLRGGTVS